MANNARERKSERMRTRGWFTLPDRPGDRTLRQQLEGLDPLLAEVRGKSVLDVGCAEGLISLEVAAAGAAHVDGVEIVPGHIAIATKLAGERNLPCVFTQADANQYRPSRMYDVVLLLAILHKLQEPEDVCKRLVSYCDDLCVIRMSPDGTDVIVDARSNKVPQYIGNVMAASGFHVERTTIGPLGEKVWYYRRRRKAG